MTQRFLAWQSADDGLIGESPYIGKGRFRQEMLSRKRGRGDAQQEQIQQQHEELDRELQEKRQSVENGTNIGLAVFAEREANNRICVRCQNKLLRFQHNNVCKVFEGNWMEFKNRLLWQPENCRS